MQDSALNAPSKPPSTATKLESRRKMGRALLVVCIAYLALLIGQPAGLDVPRIATDIANNPSAIPQQLVTGIANGAIIAIIALGYTLVYGIIELVNFAHSSVFMLGSFTSLLALSFFINKSSNGAISAPFWAALVCFIPAMIVCALLNAGIEKVAYRRLRDAPKLIVLISAIGMDFILQNVGLQLGALGKLPQVSPIFNQLSVMGSNNASPKSFPQIFSNNNLLDAIYPNFPVRVTVADVMVVTVAIVLMVALRWFVQNTRAGKAMRATAQNRNAAMIMGINIDSIITLTFLIGGALAGAAGMMFGLYNGTAVFTMGFTAGLRAFTAAVLGGIGNITGAALGGIIIGIVAAFSDQYLSVRWTNAWVFLILVLVMVFRPTGLLGQEGGEKA